VVPTTSRPPRRTSSRNAGVSQRNPLKAIRLKVTVIGAFGKELARLAADKGLAVEEKGGNVSVVISAPTPEEALARLGILSDILASRS
jgi:hypothetical protein